MTKLHIGWRTLKTAISIFLCVLLFKVLHANPAIACLSSVFSLRENTSKTFSFGKSRLISNACGGILALIIFQLNQWWSFTWSELILLPLAVIIFIQLMNLINNQAGIISGMAAFFVIFFTIPGEQSFTYAILRTADTFAGVLIAIFVNHFIHPQNTPSSAQQIVKIEQQIKVLQKQKERLEKQNKLDS